MGYRFAFAALLLPLAGCVVPPPEGPAMYPQPGYPGPYAQSDFSYPGYAYNNGSPYYVDAGVSVPLIFYGGGWGYWDRNHGWHRAPDAVWHDLDRRHPGGVGYRPWGGGPGGRPEGLRPGGFPGGGFQGRGGQPWAGRPGGAPPGGGFRPQGQAPVQRAAVGGAARPAPERHRDDQHH
jgi:translation initiation factor IF-2